MVNLNGCKILLVDDEDMLRETLTSYFEILGASVITAESGNDAFEKLQNDTFDVVVSDVRMAGGDGMTLVNKIKTNIQYSPEIILCTGFAELTNEEAKQRGIWAIFEKPFSIEELAETVFSAYVQKNPQKFIMA